MKALKLVFIGELGSNNQVVGYSLSIVFEDDFMSF